MKLRCIILLSFFISASLFSNVNLAESEWPGEPIDNHVHMTWAAMTIEVNEWADDYPEIVDLADVGKSELGRSLWVPCEGDFGGPHFYREIFHPPDDHPSVCFRELQ